MSRYGVVPFCLAYRWALDLRRWSFKSRNFGLGMGVKRLEHETRLDLLFPSSSKPNGPGDGFVHLPTLDDGLAMVSPFPGISSRSSGNALVILPQEHLEQGGGASREAKPLAMNWGEIPGGRDPGGRKT